MRAWGFEFYLSYFSIQRIMDEDGINYGVIIVLDGLGTRGLSIFHLLIIDRSYYPKVRI